MTYQEMLKAEAELKAALAPAKKQRGASKAQLAYRARTFGGVLAFPAWRALGGVAR